MMKGHVFLKKPLKDIPDNIYTTQFRGQRKNAIVKIITYYSLFLVFWTIFSNVSLYFLLGKNIQYNWVILLESIFVIFFTNGLLLVRLWPQLTRISDYQNILMENETRYRFLFENAPVSLWEQDFSAVKQALDELHKQGIEDLNAYMDEHPEFVQHCTQSIRVLDVNLQTLRLYKAANKEALLGNLSLVLPPKNNTIMHEELAAIFNGKTEFESTGRNYTLSGNPIDIRLRWSIPPGFEESFKHVLVTLVDETEERNAQTALRAAQERYRQLVEQVSAVMYTRSADEQHSLLYISPQAFKVSGYTPDEWMGNPIFWSEIIYPKDRQKVQNYCQSLVDTKEPFQLDYRIQHKNGGTIWLRDQATRVYDNQRGCDIWQGVLIDITSSRAAEHALRKSEARFRLLLQSQGEGTILFNMKGGLVFVNPAAESLFDVEADSLTNYSLGDFATPQQVNDILRRIANLSIGKSETVELDITASGSREKRVLQMTLSAWFESDGELAGGLALCRDITEQKIDQARLRYQSWHDALTGLYNRHYFEECLNRFVRQRAFPISLIMIDVDGLKQINDQQGHSAGDIMLTLIAGALKSALRSQDIVARIGGDEFAILLPGQDEYAVDKVIARVQVELKRLQEAHPEQKSPLSISMGSATAFNEDSVQMIFHLADQAMYTEKNKKKKSI